MYALVDCNNFYVSCERIFQPQFEGTPVIVLSNNDGCVISRSNEAKALGIKMGEPAFKIEKFLFKHKVAVFSSNYALYGDMSDRVMKTLAEFVPNIEIYSIDEAFLDFSGQKYQNLCGLATKIRKTVRKWTGMPVSIGIAPTKTLAKVANHIAKKSKDKNGIYELNDDKIIEDALENFPIDDLWGIGRRYSKYLLRNGINTALQLRNTNDNWIKKNLSVMGLRLVKELRGIPCISLETVTPVKKGIRTARSFGKMITSIEPVKEAVATFAARCAEKLRKQRSCANVLSVFIETNRFKENELQYNNSKVMRFPVATNSTPELIHYAITGLKMIYKSGYKYKKAGVFVTGIVPDNQIQYGLFDTVNSRYKKLMPVYDQLNKTMGRDVVRYAAQGFDRKWKLRQEKLSPCYTTRWDDILKIGMLE